MDALDSSDFVGEAGGLGASHIQRSSKSISCSCRLVVRCVRGSAKMNMDTTFTAGALQRFDAVRCGLKFNQGLLLLLLLLGRKLICELLGVLGACAVNAFDLLCV